MLMPGLSPSEILVCIWTNHPEHSDADGPGGMFWETLEAKMFSSVLIQESPFFGIYYKEIF